MRCVDGESNRNGRLRPYLALRSALSALTAHLWIRLLSELADTKRVFEADSLCKGNN